MKGVVNMLRRFFALITALLMVAAVMGGCADTGNSAPTISPTSIGGTATDDPTTSEPASNFNEVGYPIVNEKITLRFMSDKGGLEVDYDDPDYIWQDFEEVTNIHIEWDNIPLASIAEKKNLALATGDLPDAFVTGGGGILSAADQATYGPQGVLLDLTDLIEQYSPNIQAMFAQNVNTKIVSTSSDGKIYSLPFAQEIGSNLVYNRLYINRVWLEELKLDIPTTTEEFVEVLKAFKNDDPNGNEQQDEIPLSFIYDNHNRGSFGFFTPFGCLDNASHVSVYDGKVVFEPITDGYKEGVKWLASIFQEGLIDPEVFTHDAAQYHAKGQTDTMTYGVFSNWSTLFGPYTVGTIGDGQNTDYVTLPPLKGPDGTQMWQSRSAAIWNGAFAITSANKNIPETMRWVDLCYDPEWSFELQYGPLDYTLEKDDNGVYSFIETEDPALQPLRSIYAPGLPPSYISADFFENRVNLSSGMQKDYDQYNTYAEYIDFNYMPAVSYTNEELEANATLEADIMPYVESTQAKWIVGEGDIDADWDAYVEAVNRMDLEKLLANYQAAYDRYIELAN